MTTRLEIAREALLEIAAHDPHVAVYRCSCWKTAEAALAAIDAAPAEIVLTREDAAICVDAMDASLARYTQRTADLRERLFGELWPQKETETE